MCIYLHRSSCTNKHRKLWMIFLPVAIVHAVISSPSPCAFVSVHRAPSGGGSFARGRGFYISLSDYKLRQSFCQRTLLGTSRSLSCVYAAVSESWRSSESEGVPQLRFPKVLRGCSKDFDLYLIVLTRVRRKKPRRLTECERGIQE